MILMINDMIMIWYDFSYDTLTTRRYKL